jgi:hypothetical protein
MNTCHQARARIVSSRLYLVERQLGMLALIGLVLLSNFPAQRRAAQTNPKPHRKTLVRRSPKHPAPSTTS